MTKFTATIASTAAALLLAGNAFAAGPVAGEGPLFNGPDAAGTSFVADSAQRQDLRVGSLAQMPASGELTADNTVQQAPEFTRAQVRAQTRDAIAHGVVVKSGEQS